MSRNGILTHTTLHPHLAQLVAGLVDGHARLIVVHTAQDQVHTLVTTEMPVATVIKAHTITQNEWMCVRVCTSMYINVCVFVHVRTVYVCVGVCVGVCVLIVVCALHICMHDCVWLFVVRLYVHIYPFATKNPNQVRCVCVSVCVSVCVCVCVCM